MITHFGAFLTVAVLVIVTPGQDTALTIRNSLLGGRRGGVFTALGVASGQAVWALAASAGIAAVLVASEPVFVALKLAGAAYVVFLGVQALRSAFRPVGQAHADRTASAPLPGRIAYRQGVISNLGNPKMAVFFTGLLPQFASPGDATFLALLVLGLLFCSLTLAWLFAYAIAVAKAGNILGRSRVCRALDAVTGAVLVAFGVRLAVSAK